MNKSINEYKIDNFNSYIKNLDKKMSNFPPIVQYELYKIFELINYSNQMKDSSYNNDANIHEMIIRRLDSYIHFNKGLNIYKNFLKVQNIIIDDIYLIDYYNLKELQYILIENFYNNILLQNDILKAIVKLSDESSISFLYDVTLQMDEKLASIAVYGLDKFKNQFNNWKNIKGKSEIFNEYLSIINRNNFSIDFLKNNNINNIFLLVYWSLKIEENYKNIDQKDIYNSLNIIINEIKKINDSSKYFIKDIAIKTFIQSFCYYAIRDEIKQGIYLFLDLLNYNDFCQIIKFLKYQNYNLNEIFNEYKIEDVNTNISLFLINNELENI